jgi:hypothetical protein
MAEKDEKKPEEKLALSKVEGKEERPAPKDNLVVTQHKVRIGVRYRYQKPSYPCGPSQPHSGRMPFAPFRCATQGMLRGRQPLSTLDILLRLI